MRRPNQIIGSMILAGIGMLVLAPLSACDQRSHSEYDQFRFVQAVAQAGFAADILRKIEEGDLEKAKEILQFQLARGLIRAGELSDETIKLGVTTPEIKDSLKRAKNYVQDHTLGPDLEEAADKAINYLDQEPRR